MSTTPTPDTVLRALWDADFDLPRAAATLRIPLAQFVLLLQQPGYAEPLDALHQAARQCLDLKAAKSVGVIVDALRRDLEACEDQPESRRIATALTKAVNAATRLTRGATIRAEAARGLPRAQLHQALAAGGAGVPPAAARTASAPPYAPPNPHPEIRHPQSRQATAA